MINWVFFTKRLKFFLPFPFYLASISGVTLDTFLDILTIQFAQPVSIFAINTTDIFLSNGTLSISLGDSPWTVLTGNASVQIYLMLSLVQYTESELAASDLLTLNITQNAISFNNTGTLAGSFAITYTCKFY